MRRTTKLLVAAAAGLAVISPGAEPATARSVPDWKGAEQMALLALVPAPDRCGAALQANLAGHGLDTAGGAFAVTASACLDADALTLTDLEATDRYTSGAGSVHIAPGDVALQLDPTTCVATNAQPVPYTVAGGTGAFDGATGQGSFDIALAWPPCGAAPQPAYVWFSGELTVPG